MAASKGMIREWLRRGKESGATHVIIVCDTWDYEDYPSYINPGESVQEKLDYYQRADMQRVMEVYDLSMDIESQLAEGRAWHL